MKTRVSAVVFVLLAVVVAVVSLRGIGTPQGSPDPAQPTPQVIQSEMKRDPDRLKLMVMWDGQHVPGYPKVTYIYGATEFHTADMTRDGELDERSIRLKNWLWEPPYYDGTSAVTLHAELVGTDDQLLITVAVSYGDEQVLQTTESAG